MLQRVDAANLVAVPHDSDVIDASSGSMTVAQIEARDEEAPGRAGRRRRRRLRVPGQPGQGAGVVRSRTGTASSPPARPTGARTCRCGATARRSAHGTGWDKNWAMYPDGPLIESDRIEGGQIQSSTIRKHFITAGLKSFHGDRPLDRRGAAPLRRRPAGQLQAGRRPRQPLRQLPPGVPGHPPAQRDANRRPRLPAVVVGDRRRRLQSRRQPRRRTCWPASLLLVGQPDSARQHALHPEAAQPGELCPGAPSGSPRPTPTPTSWALRYRYRLDSGAWHWAMANMFEFFDMSNGRAHRLGVRGRLGRKPRSAHRPLHLHDQGQPQLTTARGGGSSVRVVYHRRR